MRYFALKVAIHLSLLSATEAIPVDAVRRNNVARAKSYSVVNVDGGSTSSPAETVVQTVSGPTHTTTEVVSVTDVTTKSVVAPHPPSFTLATTPESSVVIPTSAPAITAEPSVVTIVVTASGSLQTTEYYDDGMWHTRYPIKSPVTTEAAGPAATASLLAAARVEQYDDDASELPSIAQALTATFMPTRETPGLPFPTLRAPSAPYINHTEIPPARVLNTTGTLEQRLYNRTEIIARRQFNTTAMPERRQFNHTEILARGGFNNTELARR